MKGFMENHYSAETSNSFEDAYYRLGSNSYDTAILHCSLNTEAPEGFCRQVRDSGWVVPIIVLARTDRIEERISMLDSGADDCMSKPFRFEELLARVRALLRRGAAVGGTTLRFGSLILDLRRKEALREGRRIELTYREYALLEFLLRNQNKVVSRTEILENVWDYHFESDSNIVDVFMYRLRKKIDNDFRNNLIHTVRATGYMLGNR